MKPISMNETAWSRKGMMRMTDVLLAFVFGWLVGNFSMVFALWLVWKGRDN